MTHPNDPSQEPSHQQYELNPGAVVVDIRELAKVAPAGSLYQRLSEVFTDVDLTMLDARRLYGLLSGYLTDGARAGVQPYTVAERTLPSSVRGHTLFVNETTQDRVQQANPGNSALRQWSDVYVIRNGQLRGDEVAGKMWITDYAVRQSIEPTDRGFIFSDENTTQYTVWFAEQKDSRIAVYAGPRENISESVIATLDLHVSLAPL